MPALTTLPYDATFLKMFIRQMYAIIQRDQRKALDLVGGLKALPNIVDYQLGASPTQQFPALLITPAELLFNRDTHGALDYRARILIIIAVAHQDIHKITELIQDYVAALDAIINNLVITTFADFYTSMPVRLPHLRPDQMNTIPLLEGTVKEMFVARHMYDEVQRSRNDMAVLATLELYVDRMEPQNV